MGWIPLQLFLVTASAGGGNPRCLSDQNAAGCNINSTGSEVIAIGITAAIVGLVLFDIAWKLRFGTRGPVMRLMVAAGLGLLRVVSPRGRAR